MHKHLLVARVARAPPQGERQQATAVLGSIRACLPARASSRALTMRTLPYSVRLGGTMSAIVSHRWSCEAVMLVPGTRGLRCHCDRLRHLPRPVVFKSHHPCKDPARSTRWPPSSDGAATQALKSTERSARVDACSVGFRGQSGVSLCLLAARTPVLQAAPRLRDRCQVYNLRAFLSATCCAHAGSMWDEESAQAFLLETQAGNGARMCRDGKLEGTAMLIRRMIVRW